MKKIRNLRSGPTAMKNLTVGTHLKSGDKKAGKIKKWTHALENTKAKLLGQAHVANQN